MKKVFCIYPPSEQMNRTARCQQPIRELVVLPPLPPTDLMYCAAVARETGAICKIKDYSVEGGGISVFKKDVADFKPDILLINIASTSFNKDIKAAEAAKEVAENILIVLIGAHFSVFNESVLKEYSFVDIVIRGEPEITFRDVVSGKSFAEIDGITYRSSDGSIISNSDRKFLENLDEIPFPARELVRNDLYVRPDNGEKQAIIRVAAGCPYHCFFCLATPVSGNKVRYRSVDNIIAEIKECISIYNIHNFVFWSDLFTANHVFVKELCTKIIEEKLNIIWSANSRVDTVNRDILLLMQKSGCSLVSFGIESGSQEILDKIGKNFSKEQAISSIKMCKEIGIKVFAYFVLGLPWENKGHILETINFALQLDPDYVNFYTAAALPGSDFYNYVLENFKDSLNDNDFYKSPYYYPCVQTHYLAKEDIKNLHKFAVKKFYLRPKYIFKKLFEIKTLKQFYNYFKAGMNVILKK